MWGGGAVALIALSVAVLASWLLYQHTINLLTQNLRERLLSISITQAANIDAQDLEALQVEEDWKKPEWARVVTKLKKAKDSNPNIVFMYIIRKTKHDPTQMEFVADAESANPYANADNDPTNDVDANGDGVVEPDGADKLQWPGQDYPEAVDIPEAYEAFKGQPITVAELYEDSYGRVLTGYAPITNASGTVVAILATDIKADDFFTVTTQTLYPFLTFIAGLILIIAILAITLIYIWKRRAEILAKFSRELEIANQKQESLLHFIGHEVKGFLTEGQNAFAGIVEGDYGQAPPNMHEIAQRALAKMRAGVATVMDILDASNLKKGTMSYAREEFDMTKAVVEVRGDLALVASAKQLDVTSDVPSSPVLFTGDQKKIKHHVLRNLIENSIKYTSRGSVHIALTANDRHIRFMVEDTGIGITPEDMRRLFTEGGKGRESTKVNVDSTGYGLYVAKSVVEAHGGKIWAESEGEGKGSRFIVELPKSNA